MRGMSFDFQSSLSSLSPSIFKSRMCRSLSRGSYRYVVAKDMARKSRVASNTWQGREVPKLSLE